MMMMLQRALFVVRRIAGSLGLMPVIMVIVIAMIMQVHYGEDIAGIHAEGAHLKTGADAQHKQPYGNTLYQRR